MDAKHGRMKYVLNVQIIISLIIMVFVVKLNLNAKLLIELLVFVKNVMKDIKSKTDNVFKMIFLNLQNQDVKPGLTENVFNALQGGSLMLKESAKKYATYAELGIKITEVVYLVIMVMLLTQKDVLLMIMNSDHQLIVFALNGKEEFV